MFENVLEDIRMQQLPGERYSRLRRTVHLLTSQELHGVLIYRFGHWVEYRCRVPVLRQVLQIVYFFLRKVSELLLGVGIWPESDIGPGFKIEHCGCIFISARIGSHCRVSQQVVIGHRGGFRGGGVPTLGDEVYVGAGAKILGEVTVGRGAVIGANAVVISDIEDGALAVGVPARVKARKALPAQGSPRAADGEGTVA